MSKVEALSDREMLIRVLEHARFTVGDGENHRQDDDRNEQTYAIDPKYGMGGAFRPPEEGRTRITFTGVYTGEFVAEFNEAGAVVELYVQDD